MITLSVNIKRNDLDKLRRAAPKKAGIALEALAREGERFVKQGMQDSQSPSTPGQMPGIDTGTLWNSIHVENRGELARAVVAGTEYAAPLEFGTTHMAARPFMQPMSAWLKDQTERVFADFLD